MNISLKLFVIFFPKSPIWELIRTPYWLIFTFFNGHLFILYQWQVSMEISLILLVAFYLKTFIFNPRPYKQFFQPPLFTTTHLLDFHLLDFFHPLPFITNPPFDLAPKSTKWYEFFNSSFKFVSIYFHAECIKIFLLLFFLYLLSLWSHEKVLIILS